MDGSRAVGGAAGVGCTTEIHPGTVLGRTMSDTDDVLHPGAFTPSAPRRHGDRRLPLLDRALAKG
ncbi:hypothetical protein ACFRCX_15560 [Streptomyces sp. NPDC056652]|uniref:hypothetical protein n=1 Tax=Streptomyces sp. NPDC056652 TaxID=3345893 RepID=UPI0036CD6279